MALFPPFTALQHLDITYASSGGFAQCLLSPLYSSYVRASAVQANETLTLHCPTVYPTLYNGDGYLALYALSRQETVMVAVPSDGAVSPIYCPWEVSPFTSTSLCVSSPLPTINCVSGGAASASNSTVATSAFGGGCAGRWSCCGAKNEWAPGCVPRPHAPKEMMISVRAEGGPPVLVGGTQVELQGC